MSRAAIAQKSASPSHTDYKNALRLVGKIIASPHLPKSHQKLTPATFPAFQADFSADGRNWMNPAVATAPTTAAKKPKPPKCAAGPKTAGAVST